MVKNGVKVTAVGCLSATVRGVVTTLVWQSNMGRR